VDQRRGNVRDGSRRSRRAARGAPAPHRACHRAHAGTCAGGWNGAGEDPPRRLHDLYAAAAAATAGERHRPRVRGRPRPARRVARRFPGRPGAPARCRRHRPRAGRPGRPLRRRRLRLFGRPHGRRDPQPLRSPRARARPHAAAPPVGALAVRRPRSPGSTAHGAHAGRRGCPAGPRRVTFPATTRIKNERVDPPAMTGDVAMRSPSLTVAALAAAGLAAALPAAAAEPPALEEIVVTAQKREQSSEDLGMALSVLDRSALTEQRILGLADVSRLVPSLDVFRGNGSNNPTITLRGIGTTNPWVNNNPSVAAHADGVYLPMSAYLTFPLFDLERVEVLKGPQIGLYGRNSTAGAINFVSRRPGPEPSAYVDGSYGNYDALDLQAAVGGPLGERLQGRIAALYQSGGGYMDRPGTVGSTAGFSRAPGVVPGVPAVEAQDDYGDKDVLALRGSLAFAPRDDFDVFFSVHYAQDDSEIIGSTSVNGDALGLFMPPSDDAFKDYDNARLENDSEQLGGVLELTWQLGDYQLVSVTGMETLERAYDIGDMVPLRLAEASFDEDLESFYQELRVAYQPSEDFRWLGGVSYTKDEIDY